MQTRYSAHIYGWLLLLPAAVLLVAFTHAPMVSAFVDSFMSTPKGARPARFVGLMQYETLIEDPIFWRVLGNNILFAVWTIPASIALAIAMALLVNGKLKGRGFLRMAYFTPTVLPMIAVANIWMFFFTPDYGLIDQVRGLFGGAAVNWLGQQSTALYCLMVVTVWKEAGFFMIFYLAALQGISPSLYEAASLEGASRWTVFRRITWPLLMPTTLFVLINAVIGAFRLVDHVVVMTKGGPDNASSLLLFYIYEIGFKYWDTAYASTLTVVLLVLLAAVAVFQFTYLDKRTHYQ
jgi:sn-glycerol 3-phosphate transport system permease protein